MKLLGNIDSRLPTALWALAVLFLLLRFVHLDYDTPLFFANYGQSEITDPYMYSSFARNKTLFNDWDPYRYDRWTSWKVSTPTIFSYVTFSVAGTNRWSANLAGILMQTLGLGLILLVWRRWRPRGEVALLAVFLAVSTLLFTSSRAPFLEDGVILVSGMALFAHAFVRQRVVASVVCGALVGVAMYSGKLTAVALLAPLIGDYFFSDRQTALKRAGWLILGLLGATALYAGLFYDGSFGGMVSYYRAHLGAVSFPLRWSASPLIWLEAMLTFGSVGGLSRFQPFGMALAIIGLLFICGKLLAGERKKSELRAGLFAALWLIAGTAPLIPVEYRPYRYFVSYLPALFALAAIGITALSSGALKLSLSGKRWKLQAAIVVLALMYICAQIYSGIMQYQTGAGWIPLTVGLMALFAVIALGAALAVKWRPLTVPRSVTASVAALLAVGLLVFNASTVYRALEEPGATMKLQSRDFGELVNSRALVAGNYAPQATIDNDLGCMIYPFGLKYQERDLFAKYPVTHLAVVSPVMESARNVFPELSAAVEIVRFWSRGGSFVIYYMPGRAYSASDFERAMIFRSDGQSDSTVLYLERSLARNPGNLTARLELAQALALDGRSSEAERLAGRLAEEYSSLHYVRYLLGRVYFALSDSGRTPHFVKSAIGEFERAAELNPEFAKTMKLRGQIDQLRRQLYLLR